MNQPHRKIVFLDIDGVLNSSSTLSKRLQAGLVNRGGLIWIHPEHVAILNRLIHEVEDVEFVLSSSWRMMHELDDVQSFLEQEGFEGKLIDKTDRMYDHIRGSEIGRWLSEKGTDVQTFVILDDDSDMGPLMPHLVKTTFDHGLCDEHVDEVIRRFNEDRETLNILDEEINLTTDELESLKEQVRNKRDDIQTATEDLDRLKSAQEVIRKELSGLIDDNIVDVEVCREIIQYLMTKLGLTNWGNTLASFKENHKSEIAWLVSQGYLHTFPGRGEKDGPQKGQAVFSLDSEKTSKSTSDFYKFYEEYRKNRQSVFENSTAVVELKQLLS